MKAISTGSIHARILNLITDSLNLLNNWEKGYGIEIFYYMNESGFYIRGSYNSHTLRLVNKIALAF